ncbi:hypothetical protein SAMN02910370_01285 [Lachnospiraceae bacterium XPB1003]|nr:hypothetical protein SAMN02910370_01285 [Lachnospiraceae bacterium XPB1003]
MKNIRFYEAEKYKTAEYEMVEKNIYKTFEVNEDDEDSLALQGVSDKGFADSLKKKEGWKQGTGDFLETMLVLTYEGKTYYRDMDNVDTEDDVVFENMNDPENPNEIFVTSIVFEAEPELGENEPSDEMISQYPLEDILDEYYVYVSDDYPEKNASDKVNSYIEFASEDIEDIRKLLGILGKHVYNKPEGEYVMLKVE